MIVDVVASFIAVLGSIMLPMIDKLFCLRIVLLQDFLQHSDWHVMLLREAQPPDDQTSSRRVYDEGHQHDAWRKEHHLAL